MRVLVLALALVSLATLATLTTARKPMAARYDNFRVYKAFVKDNEQLEEFKKIHQRLQVGLVYPRSPGGSLATELNFLAHFRFSCCRKLALPIAAMTLLSHLSTIASSSGLSTCWIFNLR